MFSFWKRFFAPEAFRIVGDVRAMRLSPGDVVVFTLDHDPDDEQRESFAKNAKLIFPDNKVLVLTKKVGIEVAKDSEGSPAC